MTYSDVFDKVSLFNADLFVAKEQNVGGSWSSQLSFQGLSQELVPQVFVQKLEVKKTHKKTVSCKDMDSTDDDVFCICEVLKAQASSWQFDTLKRKEKLWSGFDEPKELGIEYWQLGVLIDCYRPLNFGPRCSLEFYYFQEVHMMRVQAANANKVEVQDQWSWGFTVVACCHALILNWRQKVIILLCLAASK